jgi:pimeloyl-ACP methyl ester carboxylesterase
MDVKTPSRSDAMTSQTPATAILVHGAFSDASAWGPVIADLQRSGIPVTAPANPLRGTDHDAAYIASIAGDFEGPVVLVGHSYGGVVITQAAERADNVTGLVYVAAFALEEGESPIEVVGRFPAAALAPALRSASRPGPTGEPVPEISIDPVAFPGVFGADLPPAAAAVASVAQRPVTAAVFEETSATAAWKRLPSWFVVSAQDQAIHPEAQRFMASRAGAATVELGASHAVALSQPAAVADVIRSAARVAERQAA